MTAARRINGRDTEDGQAYEVTVPVDLATLGEEIKKAHNWRSDLGLTCEGDPTQASKKNPVVLWVMRTDAVPATVRSAVTAHQGVESAPREVDRLRAKAAAGDDLTQEEIQKALRLLLTRGT